MTKLDKNKKTVEAYDKNPQFYADKFDSYGVRNEDIDRAIKLNESGSNQVLELGCGNGRDAQYIISKVGIDNYIGIDASEGLVKLAREKNPGAVFHVKDMRDVSYETSTFGIIFSFAAMLHLKHEELGVLIDKYHKSLKSGGILYISTKYGEYKEIEIENLGSKKYYYAYTPEDIRKLAGTGFEVVYNVIQDSDYGPELVIALRNN
jgi:SAM-dependent methyltransferase